MRSADPRPSNDDTGKTELWPVFICYRQADGLATATRLHEMLDKREVKREGGRPIVLDVYLDQTMPAVADWRELHRPYLERARALIVVCSPGAKIREGDDDWVHREIEWWLAHRETSPILIDPLRQGIRYVPDCIRSRWPEIQRIPLVESELANLPPGKLDEKSEALRRQVVGAILPSGAEIYVQEIQAERRRARRLTWALATSLAFMVAMLGAGLYAYDKRRDALMSGRISQASLLDAEAASRFAVSRSYEARWDAEQQRFGALRRELEATPQDGASAAARRRNLLHEIDQLERAMMDLTSRAAAARREGHDRLALATQAWYGIERDGKRAAAVHRIVPEPPHIFSIELINAGRGESVLVHYGTPDSTSLVMINSGPRGEFEKVVRPRLERLSGGRFGGKPVPIELLVASDQDFDKVDGLRAMLKVGGAVDAGLVELRGVWANIFAAHHLRGEIRHLLAERGVPLNRPFDHLVMRPEAGRALVTLPGGLEVMVLGPGRQHLEALHREARLSDASARDLLAPPIVNFPDERFSRIAISVGQPVTQPAPDVKRDATCAPSENARAQADVALMDEQIPNLASTILLFRYRGKPAAAHTMGLQPNPAFPLPDLVAAVDEALAGRPGWLLVLDNVDDAETVRPCIPISDAGQVLITTRLDDVAALGVAQPLQIAPLTAAESRAFLRRRTRRDAVDAADDAALDELVDELDGLPLALEQAAAYIAQTRARFDAYLASLRRGRLELLERGKPSVSPYASTVGSTWRMNLERIGAESPAAAELLRLCAFLAPDPLPLAPLARAATTERFSFAGAIEQIVLAPEDWRYTHVLGTALRDALRNSGAEPLRIYELVAPLLRYSLVRIDAAHDAIVVHRVLQDVVRAALDADDARLWAGRALEMVDLVFPRAPAAGVGVNAEADALLPHALAAIANARRYCPDDGLLPQVLEVAGCYLLAHASLARAVPLLTECADLIQAKSGLDAERLAVALHNLGTACNELGRYDDAEQALRRALHIREASGATNELARAKTQDVLGNLLVRSGRAAEAEPLHRSALSTFERVAGADSELVATSCQFLSTCAAALGHWDEARALNQRSVALYRKLVPPSLSLATALYNLALSLSDPAEALRHLQEARDIFEVPLGADNLLVARLDAAMAMQHRHLGNAAAAEPLLLQALAVFDRELPANHVEVAGPLDVLASVRVDLGRPADAVGPLERAHAILTHHLGATSVEALQALASLVQNLYASRQFDRGIPLSRALVDGMTQSGVPAVSTTMAWNLYGSMLHGAGCYADAREAHQRVLALLEANPEAPLGFVATTLNNIASTHHVQNHADEAERGYCRALELFARAAPDDPMRKVCATNFALLLRSAGRNDDAARVEAESGVG